mgnify:CR=1 FL=1
MAFYENQDSLSFEADSDLSDNQFHFMSSTTGDRVGLTGAGEYAIGVLQNDPAAAGRAAQVAIDGKLQVKCGGAVTAGSPMASDANGRAVNATTGAIILGEALEAGATGEVITILFHPRGAA